MGRTSGSARTDRTNRNPRRPWNSGRYWSNGCAWNFRSDRSYWSNRGGLYDTWANRIDWSHRCLCDRSDWTCGRSNRPNWADRIIRPNGSDRCCINDTRTDRIDGLGGTDRSSWSNRSNGCRFDRDWTYWVDRADRINGPDWADRPDGSNRIDRTDGFDRRRIDGAWSNRTYWFNWTDRNSRGDRSYRFNWSGEWRSTGYNPDSSRNP